MCEQLAQGRYIKAESNPWLKLEESLESGYKNTGQKWRQKLHGRLQEVSVCPYQLIRTQQICPHRPCGSREPYDQLVRSDGNRQGAGVIFQVDQRGSTYPQGRPTRYESGRGQLSTQSRLRPLS